MRIYSGTIASSFQDVNFVVLDIIEIIKLKCDIREKDLLFKISFMLREVMNNAVEHGNHFDEDKKVICIVEYEAPMLIFKIQDQGEGINLKKGPFESADNYLLRERHRGYALIQELNFLIEFDGNQVSVKLNLGQIHKEETSHGEDQQ